MMKEAKENVLNRSIDDIIQKIYTLSEEHAGTAMLSRTHGQPATPTTLGKEMANFAYRLSKQAQLMRKV
jgi:adenylosuccinate lyase